LGANLRPLGCESNQHGRLGGMQKPSRLDRACCTILR
jgi:hypothetical protein